MLQNPFKRKKSVSDPMTQDTFKLPIGMLQRVIYNADRLQRSRGWIYREAISLWLEKHGAESGK